MKKRLAIALALVACLVAGSVTTAIGKPKVKKVETTLTLSHTTTGTAPYNQSAFSGQVSAKKGCKKARDITVRNTGTGTVVGTTTSDSNGSYSVSLSTAAPAGTYQAEAAKKQRKNNNGTKIVCKKGTSNTVTVQ
jgi:hypothetical protein